MAEATNMRQITYVAAAVLMTLALGCSPRDRRDTASTVDSAAADVSRETGEAAEDIREEVGDYSYERRDEFKRDLDQRLQRLDQEIAELERTTKKGVDKARDSAVVHIRAIRKSVNRSLDRLGAATASTWEEMQDGVSRAVDSLDLAVRDTRSDAKPMGGAGPS
jgi:F0F1-type ATP synthase membrane subunit b/b'